MKEIVEWIKEHWDNIPDEYKKNLKPNHYSNSIEGLKEEGHYVVLLVDRQKPSVVASYDFDEERLGINRFGQVIWGFDSGCSCPSPWSDTYPECYKQAKTWKEFEVNTEGFDPDFLDEAVRTFREIKEKIGDKCPLCGK